MPELPFPTPGESQTHYLIRIGKARPRFLQGAYPFIGHGIAEVEPLNDGLTYIVPKRCTAELIYFRAGNLSDDLIYLTVMANGKAIRYFPVGPKSDVHVPLAIVESYPEATRFEIGLAAPNRLTGTVILDAGLIETDAGA